METFYDLEKLDCTKSNHEITKNLKLTSVKNNGLALAVGWVNLLLSLIEKKVELSSIFRFFSMTNGVGKMCCFFCIKFYFCT